MLKFCIRVVQCGVRIILVVDPRSELGSSPWYQDRAVGGSYLTLDIVRYTSMYTLYLSLASRPQNELRCEKGNELTKN